MQAIVTKYLPATNTRGSRIKAMCEAHSITMSWPHDSNDPHRDVALALVKKLGWTNDLVEGGLPLKFGGNVYVMIDKAKSNIIKGVK